MHTRSVSPVLIALILGCAASSATPAEAPPVQPASSPALEQPPSTEVAEVEPEPEPVARFPRLAEPAEAATAYDRASWKHWIDEDGDCQDTRQEVLIAESRKPVAYRDKRTCKVARGEWSCPFTGETITNPKKLDVDHLVPLANAHASGGAAWAAERRERYANSLSAPEHLAAVTAAANRSRGAKGPEQWLPPNEDARCPYVADWITIKLAWDLSAPARELDALKQYTDTCEDGGVPVVAGTPSHDAAPTPSRTAKPLTKAEVAKIKQAIVEDSITNYDGNCPCPFHTMSNGRRCGGRSAWSRGGGEAPICYAREVTSEMVEEYRP